MQYALKSVFDRQRPLEGPGNGEFEASSGARYSSSFPSGHAIETFALASVFAHEYSHKPWVQVLTEEILDHLQIGMAMQPVSGN